MRAILVSVLVVASVFACEGANGDEAAGPIERAQRQAARKVEQTGEALRQASADGSLLVQSPAPPDAANEDK